MDDQVVDLAHPGRAVRLRLLRILEPETVQHMYFRIVLEAAMQEVRHLLLGLRAGSLAGVRVHGLPLEGLRDHLEDC